MKDWNEYQRLAMRTSRSDGKTDHKKNGIMGLAGETGEVIDLLKKWEYQSDPSAKFPKAKIIEELGDVLWYVAETLNAFGIEMEKVSLDGYLEKVNVSASDIAIMMQEQVTEIIHAVKLGNTWKVTYECRELMYLINDLARYCKTTIETCASGNIRKLRARYPNGFDPEKSMERYQ